MSPNVHDEETNFVKNNMFEHEEIPTVCDLWTAW